VTKHGKSAARTVPCPELDAAQANPLKGTLVSEKDIVSPVGKEWEADGRSSSMPMRTQAVPFSRADSMTLDDLKLRRPIRNPDHALRPGDDGWAVLVNLDNAFAVALNETGMWLWRKCDGSAAISEILATIRMEFKDAPPEAEQDMLSVMETLRDTGLIGFEVES
jgi:hypothetical protein